MTDQERERERAIRELARLLGPVTNLKDPEAAAARYVDWLIGEHWRWVAPPSGWKVDPPNPEATARGVDLAREAHGIAKNDTYRTEHHVIDAPLVRVFQYDLDDDGRRYYDPLTDGVATRKPFDVLIKTQPPSPEDYT
jgi:hypothetical protein